MLILICVFLFLTNGIRGQSNTNNAVFVDPNSSTNETDSLYRIDPNTGLRLPNINISEYEKSLFDFEEIDTDTYLPDPTPAMLLEKERQLFVGKYSVIDNLTPTEREIIEIS
jgi:hypothetical protein